MCHRYYLIGCSGAYLFHIQLSQQLEFLSYTQKALLLPLIQDLLYIRAADRHHQADFEYEICMALGMVGAVMQIRVIRATMSPTRSKILMGIQSR